MRGDGRVFNRKGSPFVWIAYWAPRPGRGWGEVRESSHSSDPDVAARLLKRRLREIGNHRSGVRRFGGPAQEKITIGELLDALLKFYEVNPPKRPREAKAAVRRVREFFGDLRAMDVTADTVREYVARRSPEVKPATINRALEKLRRCFNLAIEDGRLAFAPHIPKLREENARQGFVSRKEFEKRMGKVADEDYRDFFEWLYWTGMRPGAAQALTWEGFDRETWTLTLHASGDKTGRGIPFELSGEFRKIIERRLSKRRLDSAFIFHQDGRRVSDKYGRAWRIAGTEAKVPERVVYDLRRTALRNNVRAGIPERVAMALSGHRTRSTFDRYNIVSGEDLREAVEKRSAYEARLARE
jgi:integrase